MKTIDGENDETVQLKSLANAALERLNNSDDLTPGLVLVQKQLIEAIKHLETDFETAAKWFNLVVWQMDLETGYQENQLLG